MKNKKYKNEKNIIKKYKLKQLAILLALVICFISIVTTFGRYAVKNVSDFFMRAKDFYFYSDKLKSNKATYQINNWSGTGNYVITINMNSMENNILSTNYNIDYSITYTCSSNIICQVSKQNGTIPSATNKDFFTLTIIPNTSLKTGDVVWVDVTANSESEYKKSVSASFILVVGKEMLSYEIVDSVGNQYLELNITNTLTYYIVQQAFDSYRVGDRIDIEDYLLLSEDNKKKTHSAKVTIEFDPNIVLLDITNTNYLNAVDIGNRQINGNNYINRITFLVEAISSTTVRLYKKDIRNNYTYPIVNNYSIVRVESV